MEGLEVAMEKQVEEDKLRKRTKDIQRTGIQATVKCVTHQGTF